MGKAAEVVKDLYAAFGRGDVPAVLGTFDAGIEWIEAEGFLYAAGNPYVGPQAVAEGVFGRIIGDVDNFAARPVNIIDGGDTVVAEGRYTGTWRATGTPVDAQFAHVWRVRDGKIVRFQQYTDTGQWAKAAGH
jgi:ketosteroid isomerase-like protein